MLGTGDFDLFLLIILRSDRLLKLTEGMLPVLLVSRILAGTGSINLLRVGGPAPGMNCSLAISLAILVVVAEVTVSSEHSWTRRLFPYGGAMIQRS